jgi:Tol biopolymer transport system component
MKRRVAAGLVVIVLAGTVASASSGRAGGEYRAALYAVRGDGSGDHLLVEPDPPVSAFVRSPGGRSILFGVQMDDGALALFAAERSGAHPVRLTPPGLSASYAGAAFSPDAQTVAFASYVDCGWRCTKYTLYLVARDGTGLHQVADGGYSPSWSPDGRQLAYAANGSIYVLDVQSDEATVVAPAPSGYPGRPIWAPRGNRIAYMATKGGYGVACFVNADGSRRRCTHGHSLTSLLWSPDASHIAFRQATPRVLGIVDSNARHTRYLGNYGRQARPAAWSPDGRRLAYLDSDYSEINVLRVASPDRPVRVVDKPVSFLADVRWRASGITYVAARPVAP